MTEIVLIAFKKLASVWRGVQRLLTMERILVFSFTGFILLGAFTLMLPQATNGSSLGFIDALFTSTSATCVTGLVVVDTGTKFTFFGQVLILIMIQLGGLGIITFSTAFLLVLEGRLSLGSRDLLFETLSQGPVPNIKKLLKAVFISTITIEGIGSIVLMLRFSKDMPFATAAYHAIFHSVSAFCNAGFALYSDSLIAYQDDLWVNLVICLLIIFGGLGFIVIYEMAWLRRFRWQQLSFHSKLVLWMTMTLIGTGALLFFILESRNSIENLPWGAKLLTSLFQSITARTAGFNTINLGLLSNPCLFILMVLMFIGASPASCAGGIKVTTAAIIIAVVKARFSNQEDVNLFYRRIPSESVSKAISIVFFSGLCIMICTLLLLITELAGVSHQESRGLFLELLFEVISAFGTVGLSVGVTPNLSLVGRILIITMMFIGRLGPLTIAMTVGRKGKMYYRYAQEKVLIG
ncbi:hypothetical protein JXJ21_03795 [candidate division KSB1 bacterium]|nr:hypothetical protein [candidate division KSB1 bacterium]